jgi:aerobic carbon-monoxide dehydrogenase medium subunit
MYTFDYRRPHSVDEADLALKGLPGAKLLAGGQTLIPTMKQRLNRPPTLIDLGAIAGLRGISKGANGGLIIGAMATHAAVATSADVKAAIPGLAALAEGIGDPQVRNRGTIGGSLANNDPAADYPAAAVALGASFKTSKRTLTAEQFFKGLFSTALEENEILTEIHIPAAKRFAYAKFANPASRYALVGVAVAETAAGVRVAVTGAGSDGVFRVPAMEAALAKSFAANALSGIAVDPKLLSGDMHAAADYRAHLINVMAQRAVATAAG